MKPKRPTETDLLAIVQNGFNSQLPKDRVAQASPPAPAAKPEVDSPPASDPASFVPMVRITLAIPEELRYRLKLTVMGHRRKSRDKMTQDEYCAKAIGAQLELDESGSGPWTQVAALATFLRDCMREGALAEGWVPNARTLLERIDGTSSQAFSKLI